MFWEIVAGFVLFAGGIVCGFLFGAFSALKDVARRGSFTLQNQSYTVTAGARPAGASPKVDVDLTISKVRTAMRDGHFDAELERAMARNQRRRRA